MPSELNQESQLVTPLETAVRVVQLVALLHEEKREKEEKEQESEENRKNNEEEHEEQKDVDEGENQKDVKVCEKQDGEEEVKCPEIRIHHIEEEDCGKEKTEEVKEKEERDRIGKDFKIYLISYSTLSLIA